MDASLPKQGRYSFVLTLAFHHEARHDEIALLVHATAFLLWLRCRKRASSRTWSPRCTCHSALLARDGFLAAAVAAAAAAGAASVNVLCELHRQMFEVVGFSTERCHSFLRYHLRRTRRLRVTLRFLCLLRKLFLSRLHTFKMSHPEWPSASQDH